MIVVTPADVASWAAMILVDIPPVPKLEPLLDTIVRLVPRINTWDSEIYHLLVIARYPQRPQ